MRTLLLFVALCGVMIPGADAAESDRPNILWITCEDISPHIGCYGDDYAVTPNIDGFAKGGVRYDHAYAPIGVCAPARSCLITGMYPPALGTQHMRCTGNLPQNVRAFTTYLRAQGYYCSNNVKTDYNFKPRGKIWDESSRMAHWRKRKGDQPFFSVFNFTTCHESQIRLSEAAYKKRTRNFSDKEKHDPADATVPPYHPDTPEVRKDWARYADMITFMDRQVGRLLRELKEDGLAEDTIVFFYSDHGAGMPRSKRWLYDSSLRVPLIIRFPTRYQKWAPAEAGGSTDRMVSFVDFAPTVLSLAGIPIPTHFQGQAFLGDQAAAPRDYIYGFRDRMDERYDMIRAVRDKRYKYIRNYRPELPYFHEQYIGYMYQMPTMRVWQQMADAGKLTGATAIFMARNKPVEELYDTITDPHEVKNLADSAEHADVLNRLRAEHRRWMFEIVDLGLMPEADMRTRFGKEPPYSAVRRDPSLYPMKDIARAADQSVGLTEDSGLETLIALRESPDPAIRFWATRGVARIGRPFDKVQSQLLMALQDDAPTVQVAAADSLNRLNQSPATVATLIKLLDHENEWVRLAGINVLDRMDDPGAAALPVIRGALMDANNYVKRVAEHIVRPKP